MAEGWASHVISLLDPDYSGELPASSTDIPVCRLYCNDTTPVDADDYQWFYKVTPVIADKAQVQQILQFSETLQPTDKVLVHCHAGISRSTAVACGILCQHGMTVDAAIETTIAVREIAYPNLHIIELFDDLLGLRQTLTAAVKQRFR